MKRKSIETQLIHAGEPKPRFGGAVSLPIFQSSTFEYSGEEDSRDLKYIRLNNTPNHEALHGKLAALENGEEALVTSSGMSAISTTLLTVLSSGDHLLAQTGLYGGTHGFMSRGFSSFGISVDFIDGLRPDTWEDQLQSNTKAIFVESLTNPLLEVGDLLEVVKFARAHQLVAMIDNTFTTPVNFLPLESGFDLSLHSGSKYLNGHSDIVAGAVIGRAEWVGKIKKRLVQLGGTLDPHACFLLHRGLKTLALRVRCQNESALELARFLEGHPAVEKVYYPGLEAHPQHQRARDLFNGFGGMLSLELKGDATTARQFMERTTLPIIAPSLGGVETLMTRPITTSHAELTPEELQQQGISDRLIRVSVGIEACQDLLEDFSDALTA
ncbi:MAG: aminotransferase class I/II-fold pyridoxal phosphate-dependent enzyme [Acidobacteriota bacterium]